MLKIQNNNALVNSFLNDYQDMILKRLTYVINSGLHKTKKRKAVKLSANEKKILKKFNNKKTIQFLILAQPKTLRRSIKYISNKYPAFHKKNSNIYKILYNVFISNGYDNIDKFKFIKDIV